MIFTSDGVASENHCPVASRMTKQSLFMLTHTLSYFLHVILGPQYTTPIKTQINR